MGKATKATKKFLKNCERPAHRLHNDLPITPASRPGVGCRARPAGRTASLGGPRKGTQHVVGYFAATLSAPSRPLSACRAGSRKGDMSSLDPRSVQIQPRWDGCTPAATVE